MKELPTPEEFEKDLCKSYVKKILRDYNDFQKTIIPGLKEYADISPIKSQQYVINGTILGCEMLYVVLTDYCEGKKYLSLDELKIKVNNLENCMDMLQKKYIKIITQELPNSEDNFGTEL